jgi:hypothetical protein
MVKLSHLLHPHQTLMPIRTTTGLLHRRKLYLLIYRYREAENSDALSAHADISVTQILSHDVPCRARTRYAEVYVAIVTGLSKSETISAMPQTWSVTPAAIAGVTRWRQFEPPWARHILSA